MSNKYFWKGVDINNLTNSNSELTVDNFSTYFDNFPGDVSDTTPSTDNNPSGFTTNTGYTNFKDIPENTSYYCYNSEEKDESPLYKITNENVFTKDYTTDSTKLSRIVVRSHNLGVVENETTYNIPTWCNALKFYWKSTNGVSGTTGNNKDKYHYNEKFHENHNGRHRGGGHDPGHYYNHNRENHTEHHNWVYAYGGAGGAGGTGTIGWFIKYIKFTAGSNNTIVYKITNSSAHNNYIKVYENNELKAEYYFKNGTNGNNGEHAGGPIHHSNRNVNNDHHYNSGDDDHVYDRHHERHHHRNTSYNGGAGAAGASGSCTMSNDGNAAYLHYNSSNTGSSYATVFFFKYN
tara:strand:- start:1265 stop:2308 length:1044 start_codon:yes stop_codon:yes gene_type:complete